MFALLYYTMFIFLLLISASVSLLKSQAEDTSNDCTFLKNIHADVSLELKKTGFHRELVTTVRINTYEHLEKLLLVYSWPKDVYVDPYQLASQGDQRKWKMLLDSTIDLEMPAHKSSGFRTYLYPHLEESIAGQIHVVIPIHGRYQKPNRKAFNSVVIQPPDLLLAVQNCARPNNLESFTIEDAPCTVNNISSCQWIKVHNEKLPDSVTLQLPVGDASQVILVSGGTLLLTIICCAALSVSAWTHRIM